MRIPGETKAHSGDKEGAGLCRGRTESSSGKTEAEGGTQRENGPRGSEGKVHAA